MTPGDSLYGLFGDAWEYIYNLKSNENFRNEFPDPKNILVGSVINTV